MSETDKIMLYESTDEKLHVILIKDMPAIDLPSRFADVNVILVVITVKKR